jgi:hypothetical protein
MKGLGEQTLADFEAVEPLTGVMSVFATRQKIRNRHCGPQRPFALSMARSGTAQAHRRDRPLAVVDAAEYERQRCALQLVNHSAMVP